MEEAKLIKPQTESTVFVGWAEPDQLYWVSRLNPTCENKPFTNVKIKKE